MCIGLGFVPYGFFRVDFQGAMGRNPMWITGLWYGFGAFWEDLKPYSIAKSVLMRKTIVFNLLLILGYYFILQVLVWLAMIFR